MTQACDGVTVILPSLDEAENLAVLLPRLRAAFADMERPEPEIVVVDGGSTDDTASVARSHGATVVPEEGRGYGAAIKTGIRHSRGELIVCIDADNSHPPDYVSRLLEAIEEADVVIASRYVAGGAADVAPFRRFLSLVLNGWYRLGLAMPQRDLSSGFRCYRRHLFDRIRIDSDGYQFLPELLVRAHCAGFVIREVPFHYAPRLSGRSHIRLLSFGMAYLTCFLRLFLHRWTRIGRGV